MFGGIRKRVVKDADDGLSICYDDEEDSLGTISDKDDGSGKGCRVMRSLYEI